MNTAEQRAHELIHRSVEQTGSKIEALIEPYGLRCGLTMWNADHLDVPATAWDINEVGGIDIECEIVGTL